MRKLIDLGWCVATLTTTGRQADSLLIMCPVSASDGLYEPAASVNVYSKSSLIALRDALNEAYPEEPDK